MTSSIAQAGNISHESEGELDVAAMRVALQEKCTNELKLSEDETEVRMGLFDQLTEFEFGRFLLQHKGINGYWTAYMILNGPTKPGLSELENWMLNKAPTVLATQERFRIFQRETQKRLKPRMIIASVPCGTMDDLLRLDYSSAPGCALVGIDVDTGSTELAKNNALSLDIENVSFETKDAFAMGDKNRFDILSSNGLNIYEHDDERQLLLYKGFHTALKPGGVLVTSFLTPPPMMTSEKSPWEGFVPADAMKQKIVFADVIGAKWQVFKTEDQIRAQLVKAGFSKIEIIYDRQKMFPTVIATK